MSMFLQKDVSRLWLIVVPLIFVSCYNKPKRLDALVNERYSKCDSKDSCYIDFRDYVDFDYIYIFKIGVENKGVEKAIGFDYSGHKKPFERLVLFVKGENVVIDQTDNYNVSNGKSMNVGFYDVNYKIPSDSAIFEIEMEKDGTYLLLN